MHFNVAVFLAISNYIEQIDEAVMSTLTILIYFRCMVITDLLRSYLLLNKSISLIVWRVMNELSKLSNERISCSYSFFLHKENEQLKMEFKITWVKE